MEFKFLQTSNITKFIIIGEFIAVSCLLYTLTVSVYKDYQLDQHIKNYEIENANIELENKRKLEAFEYYSSDSYIEKIAKQNLNLVNPGEEVIIIPKDELGDPQNGQMKGTIEDETLEASSNPQRWWQFFFDIRQ